MKRNIAISLVLVLIIFLTGCNTSSDSIKEFYFDKYVGEYFSSTLTYAGYLPDSKTLIFGDWFNERGNIFVRVSDNKTATFTSYGDLYELSNIRVKGNTLKCDVVISEHYQNIIGWIIE